MLHKLIVLKKDYRPFQSSMRFKQTVVKPKAQNNFETPTVPYFTMLSAVAWKCQPLIRTANYIFGTINFVRGRWPIHSRETQFLNLHASFLCLIF